MIELLRKRKTRKRAKEMLRHARHLRHMREDVVPAADLAALSAAEQTVAGAVKAGNRAGMDAAAEELIRCLERLTPRRSFSGFSENFEILVVAVAVAMAFRAYFLQPFKIPTGSMQPTLYGVHSRTWKDPGIADRLPLKAVKWLITGDWYREVRAKADGVLSGPLPSSTDPSALDWYVGGQRHRLPKDAMPFRNPGEFAEKGYILWSGSVTAGDHIFVDKVSWNFRMPRRGEIMVFSTQGIRDLQQGTHYIKRMSGLPNERISISPPNLKVDGRVVLKPESIARISSRASGYDGYQLVGPAHDGLLKMPEDSVKLGEGQYFALGDNTGNSKDSRYWGAVPRSNLVGPACVVYWPFVNSGAGPNRWGLTR